MHSSAEVKAKNTVEDQLRIITKGADTVIDPEQLRAKLERSLRENRPLVIKLGLDPTAPDIHLGHAVVLRKIRQMQDLGHRAVIVIGDFTGKIGDPTGKSKGRVALTDERVRENALTYERQIFRVLDRGKTEVRFNSEWLGTLRFEDVLRLSSTVTVARMLERDDFGKRYAGGVPIGLHEFFYPLMQAYDSVALKADIELGGTDQTYNILMGRQLQKSMGMEQQIALFMPILEGLDGVEKMSKSLGNYIGVEEDAEVMFKKVMEIPDDKILRYFALATDEHPDRIAEIQTELACGKNPRDVKYELARIITGLYHSEAETREAMAYYDAAFGRKSVPENIPELTVPAPVQSLADLVPLLVQNGFVKTNSECRRLFAQGGIRLNGESAADPSVRFGDADVLRIGKKIFVRLIR